MKEFRNPPKGKVDAHNIVPVWHASPKLEVAARTIRTKINSQLPTFLSDFPKLEDQEISQKHLLKLLKQGNPYTPLYSRCARNRLGRRSHCS